MNDHLDTLVGTLTILCCGFMMAASVVIVSQIGRIIELLEAAK